MIELDFQDAVSDTAGENGHYRPKESQFESWAQASLKTAGQTNGELTIRLVEADESQELNHEYRNKNKPTNVLSFPFEMPDEVELPTPILGDLIICVEVVNQESIEQGKEPDHHWAHMVVHGCLHLLGFDHITDEDAEEMESLETQILAEMGINDPYQPIND